MSHPRKSTNQSANKYAGSRYAQLFIFSPLAFTLLLLVSVGTVPLENVEPTICIFTVLSLAFPTALHVTFGYRLGSNGWALFTFMTVMWSVCALIARFNLTDILWNYYIGTFCGGGFFTFVASYVLYRARPLPAGAPAAKS